MLQVDKDKSRKVPDSGNKKPNRLRSRTGLPGPQNAVLVSVCPASSRQKVVARYT